LRGSGERPALRIAVSQEPASWISAAQVRMPAQSAVRLAPAETPRALQGDLEWRGDDAAELVIDVASDRFVDLANEAKREVKLLDRAPRCAGNFALERHEPLGCGLLEWVWQEKGGGSSRMIRAGLQNIGCALFML
jgi:hypothetical protein